MRKPFRIQSSDATFGDLCESLALRLGSRGQVYVPLAATPKHARVAPSRPDHAWIELGGDDALSQFHDTLRLHVEHHKQVRIRLEANYPIDIGAEQLPELDDLRLALADRLGEATEEKPR